MRLVTRKAIALGIWSAMLAVTACRTPEPKPVPTQATARPDAGTPPRVATRYRVDGAASQLHVLVYRAGALARLGHNHVLSTEQLSGAVVIDPQLDRSQLTLDLPVASFVVDDPAARAQEGDDFSAEVPPDAREGTRGNLLRQEVLDATKFPAITLRAVQVRGTHHEPVLSVSIVIKDVTRQIDVPVKISYGDNVLTARGEFTVKQSDFGMTPFSIGMGALQVRDELRVRFAIVARS